MEKIHEPCDCGALTWMLNDSETGVKLDRQNCFVLETKLGTSYLFYFCPGCGGRLPDSSRPIFYPELDEVERSRLRKLIEGIETAEQAIERLGAPDFDAYVLRYDRSGDVNPIVVTSDVAFSEPGYVLNEAESYKTRNIEYYNLSEHANIEFYFQRERQDARRFRVELVLKFLPPRHLVEEKRQEA